MNKVLSININKERLFLSDIPKGDEKLSNLLTYSGEVSAMIDYARLWKIWVARNGNLIEVFAGHRKPI